MNAMQAEVLRLEHRICSVLVDIKQASVQLHSMVKEVDAFLKDYYQQVGPLFERICQLEKQKGLHKLTLKDKSEPLFSSSSYMKVLMETQALGIHTGENSQLDREIKHIYRKLAKLCHPDSNLSKENAEEMFALVQKAYINKDLVELKRIEQFFEEYSVAEDESLEQRMLRLERHYDGLCVLLKEVCAQKQELIESRSYQLMQRVLDEALCGNDLIAVIKHNAEHRIGMLSC